MDFFRRISASLGVPAECEDQVAAQMHEECQSMARRRFPEEPIRPAAHQGFCSYTLFVGEAKVVQYRPPAHLLDLGLIRQARLVYGDLVPDTRLLDHVTLDADGFGNQVTLSVYLQERIPALSLAELRLKHPHPLSEKGWHGQREALVRDFARFVMKGYGQAAGPPPPSPPPPASLGRVGGSIRQRLEMLRDGLPARFQPAVQEALDYSSRDAEHTPWVLTHGDVVPSNVMVSEDGQRITGLVDWAEAEWLPMGLQLYGLEELLGETDGGATATATATAQYPPPKSVFRYYAEASRLRDAFWDELSRCQGGGPLPPRLAEAFARGRVLGILLWHGIAWDDGRLNRVVQEGRDEEEIQRLDLFLLGSEPHLREDVAKIMVNAASPPAEAMASGRGREWRWGRGRFAKRQWRFAEKLRSFVF